MNLSVTSLVRYIRTRLDTDNNLQNINVNGEISNFRRSANGHLYFTLKDETSAISCVMFSSKARYLKTALASGDKVIVTGSVSLFDASGSLQLYVSQIRKDGIGDLYQQYEELKNRLWNEGLFDNSHKIQIYNKYPNRIAVLCGDKSAALSDIRTCFARRWPLCTVDEYPVIVQGNEAPESIIPVLKSVDEMGYDAIILARGGGSFEDLFCFNNESLVRTIYNLNTFIVSGVGHEQDFTLTDFVADLRAPTPTAAVELITPNILTVINDIRRYSETLKASADKKINDFRKDIDSVLSRRAFLDPESMLERHALRLDMLQSKLAGFSERTAAVNKDIINDISNARSALIRKLDLCRSELSSAIQLLNAYSIDNTLKRGFSIIYKDAESVKNRDELDINDDITIRLYGGSIKATVKEKI